MLIFLYGQDTYRSRRKLKEIVESYQKTAKSGLNLTYFDGQGLKFYDLKENTRQSSIILNEKKFFVLSNIFINQSFKDEFLKNSDYFIESKDIFLFYEENKILKKDKFFNFLKKKAKNQEFQLLDGEKLKNWANKEFNELKAEISSQALDKLVQFVGNDLWRLSNEIKKLVNYKKQEKINFQDVELLVNPEIETAIFETIDAFALKDRKKALLLIHRHLEKGDSPLYLLSMINFQLRNLLVIKDLIEKEKPYYLISKITGFHPFVVKKSYQQAAKFSLAELKKIYQKIFQADLDIKTGKINPETALDLLIAEI